MTPFEEYTDRKRREYGDKFDASALPAKFVPYFNSDQRIKVRSSYGWEHTGRVGITTGWRPAFLLMARSNQIGSSDVLDASDEIIAVQYGRTYVPVANLTPAKERP